MSFEIEGWLENRAWSWDLGGGCKIPKMAETGISNSGFCLFLDQRRNDNGLFGLLHGCARPPAPLPFHLLEMSSERNLTDCYPSSFPSLKSGLYLCFFTKVGFWFGIAGKGWEAHFTPLLLWAIIYYGRIRSCWLCTRATLLLLEIIRLNCR
jgi:hypothetical protein